jgi:hypothetical protein
MPSPMDTTAPADDGAAAWVVSFPDCLGIRAVFEAMGAVLQRVTVRIVPVQSPPGYVLMADGADLGMTCCASARLHIELERVRLKSAESIEFCVDCKHVTTALDSGFCVHGGVLIEGHGDRVVVRVRSAEGQTQDETSWLKTFVDNESTPEFTSIEEHLGLRIEIDIGRFRELIKKARKWHAELVRVRIQMHKEGANHTSLVRFSFEGDADYEQGFLNQVTRDEDGSLRVRAVGDSCDEHDAARRLCERATVHFDAAFNVDRIESFLKNLPTRMLLADVGQGMPMMLKHDIGGGSGESCIRFLIAPVNDE